MALDNAQFIAELSVTDPPGTDPLSQGDDHIRTVKRATQQSFPNIDAAVTFDTATLNLAAIKNQANVFTVTRNRFTNQIDCIRSGATQLAGHFYYDEFDFPRWGLFLSTAANGDAFQMQRRDALGVLIDLPLSVSSTTGVVNFASVPEIDGAPIWIAGEIRQFVAAATPGTNWFIADGTNGTVNLQGRHLMTESGFDTVGTAHNASLQGTADAGVTGAHQLITSEMPSHDHGILGASTLGVSAGLSQANARAFMGAGSVTPAVIFTSGFGDNLVQSTGGNGTHTHPQSVANLSLDDATFSDSVRPLGFVVSSFQYVP